MTKHDFIETWKTGEKLFALIEFYEPVRHLTTETLMIPIMKLDGSTWTIMIELPKRIIVSNDINIERFVLRMSTMIPNVLKSNDEFTMIFGKTLAGKGKIVP